MQKDIPRYLLNVAAGFSAVFLSWMIGEEFLPLRDKVILHDKRIAILSDKVEALEYSDRQTRKDINQIFRGQLPAENTNNVYSYRLLDVSGESRHTACSRVISYRYNVGGNIRNISRSEESYANVSKAGSSFNANINNVLFLPGY